MSPRKSHGAYNLGGCVSLRIQPPTPQYPYYNLVGVYASAESGMESDIETPWTTTCEAHSTLVCSPTLYGAEQCHSTDFCDECRELVPPSQTTGAWSAYKTYTKAGVPRKRPIALPPSALAPSELQGAQDHVASIASDE
jgi:hypothetical protein